MMMEINNNKHEGDLIRLKCWVQNYDWSIIGNESLVTRTFSGNCDCEIEESKHCAELWMGTHDSGPSYVVGEKGIGNVSLKSWVSENPEVSGDLVVGKWGVDLPFMFKTSKLRSSRTVNH
ncbi:putative mannose-6-phosphate isomerase [Helianthus annuus]|nr:putative mannose-6-phosphate isomerase [Helianthus annuus]KAJ0449414.1 putative mannose-6-phosphate isomerase [Helianthus annuus]KAJ0629842.1 putative mannose-6-phosphate isomerase [Helianthus annuus]